MGKLGKLSLSVVLALLMVVSGVMTANNQASAKTKVKVRYYQDIKNAIYTVKNSKAPVYSTAKLTHKKGTLKSFGTKVTGYYAAHITKNGKSTIYYKFKSGSKTGWVWRGNLKKYVPAEKFNEAKMDAHFVELINAQRVKAGSPKVTVDQNLYNKVTSLRAKQIVSNYSHTDSAGNFIAADLADAAGISYSTFSENIAYTTMFNGNNGTADELFHEYFFDDAASDWGHRDNILNPETTKVAVASYQVNGKVTNVMNFYAD